MIQIVPEESSNVVHIPVTEHLHKEDYEQFVPRINELMQKHGKIRILFDLALFKGWDEGALWFGIRHFPDVERVACVGDKRWEKGIDILRKAFRNAQVRYFDHARIDQASVWVREDDQ